MNYKRILALLVTMAILLPGTSQVTGQDVAPQSPQAPYSYAFTYQGQLKGPGGPVNGTCDLRFILWNAQTEGAQVGNTLRVEGYELEDGLFTARLDFGNDAHAGGARWLEVAVRCPAGSGTYISLSPRQELTGAPAALSLALPFQARANIGGPLVSFRNSGNGEAALFGSDAGAALSVQSAGTDGLHVGSAGQNGLAVSTAGTNGVHVNAAGGDGLSVVSAGDDGVQVETAGNDGLGVDEAKRYGVRVTSAGWDGLFVWLAQSNGVHVHTAGDDGIYVFEAGEDGVRVGGAGSPSSFNGSPSNDGFEVNGAEGYGLYVGRADLDGVYVQSTAWHGVNVAGAGVNGLYVTGAGNNGVDVAGNNWAGNFHGSISVSGDCFGCILAIFGLNVGDQTLQPGQIVAIQGIQASTLDNAPALWRVVPGGRGLVAAGVVRGRAEWDEAPAGATLREGESGQRLVPRAGAVPPGEYLSIIIYGPMQVKTSLADGPIEVGARLAVGEAGLARPLKTVVVEGVSLAESAPTIGIALAAPDEEGLAWVLVNPH
jgi:hypothetical protein